MCLAFLFGVPQLCQCGCVPHGEEMCRAQLIPSGEVLRLTILVSRSPAHVWLGSHHEGQDGTVHDVVMRDVIAMVILTVQLNRLHIDIARRHILGFHGECLAVSDINLSLLKQWAAKYVAAVGGIDGIETHCAEDIPGGHLSAVLIAA